MISQIQQFKHLCRVKYEQEKAKYELDYLKQQIFIYRTCYAFEHESIQMASTLNNHRYNPAICHRYYKSIEQARTKMINSFLANANMKRQHFDKRFQLEMQHFCEREEVLSPRHKLTIKMQQLIDRCLRNITKHVECIYKFKNQLLHAEHPSQ